MVVNERNTLYATIMTITTDKMEEESEDHYQDNQHKICNYIIGVIQPKAN